MDLVIIPAHNEEETVGMVVQAIREVVDADVVLVDDGSDDHTVRVAEAAGATVLRGRRQEGYGAAMIRGFRWAEERGYRHAATIDADGQHDPRVLPKFLAAARSHDVVSGTRNHPDSPVYGAAPPDRIRINRDLTRRINARTGWSLTDAFCGLKAYRVEALRRLHLDETGYAFPIQFWVQAAAAGLTVTELPVGRIYFGTRRTFGGGLDDPEARHAYYLSVLEAEARRVGLGGRCAGAGCPTSGA